MKKSKLTLIIRSVVPMLLMILITQTKGLSQLNESDTSGFQMRIGASGFRQSGNVDLGIIRSKLDLVIRLSNMLTFKSQNNTLYQQFNGFTADNDLNSRNFLYYQSQNKLYPFIIFFAQQNFRRLVDQRIFSGVGMTWQLIQKEQHIVKISATGIYEETKFNANTFNEPYYSGKNFIRIWRPTAYINGEHKSMDRKFTINYTAYWQPGIDKVSNQRFNLEMGAGFQLLKTLSLIINYLYINEEIVPAGINQIDGLFSIGLDYQIKKQNK